MAAVAETGASSSSSSTTDPRILRSRRMLMDSLVRLLARKEFEDISVQEIADEASLNRATFYLHYADKGALLEAMTKARFTDLMDRRGIVFSGCEGALRAIALGVCDYLAETTGCPSQMARLPLASSIVPVLEAMFREGLGRHEIEPGFDRDLLAATLAWSVFGAAKAWSQMPNRMPAEGMAAKIEAMVRPIFAAGAR